MSQAPRLTGTPIMRILSKTSGELVGYLYEWDNGDLPPARFDGEVQACCTNRSRRRMAHKGAAARRARILRRIGEGSFLIGFQYLARKPIIPFFM
ncbi:MAG: hypothetical protein R3C02_27290 [Planctomycetaceae bacterium]